MPAKIHQLPVQAKVHGFTMIELVIVIVLMSIVSMAGIEIIRQSTEAYLAMSNRQALGNSARLSVERLSRELRAALPGSVRTSGSCLEFIPISVAGMYFSIPVEASASVMRVVPVEPSLDGLTGRIAVYPVGDNPHDLTSGILSPTALFGTPDADNVSDVSWTGSHSFPYRSPTSRFYMVSDPVSYCVDGNYLFRYSGYPISVTQASVASLPTSLPTSLPNRALLVSGVEGSNLPFRFSDPGLSRNAMVEINLQFSEAGEVLQVTHEAQLRNAP